MQKADESFLRELVQSAQARVGSGYYSVGEGSTAGRRSLASALRAASRIPIVAEVKFRSPAEGRLAPTRDVGKVAKAYESGGAVGISVLTEPEHFDGRLEYLTSVRRAVNIPVLMKDIIVSEVQVQAAARLGADSVLLIASVFGKDGGRRTLSHLVKFAHDSGIEVLLEVHNENEYESALSGEADVVGINNRDLRTLEVSLDTSIRLLGNRPHPKPVICESGIRTRSEIDLLRDLGADGFLLGSALMKAEDPAGTLKALSGL